MGNYDYIKQKVSELLKIVHDLEECFPGRKFTLDGHLLGSIGEALANYYYGIGLAPNNTKTYDGEKDGKRIQIKITQGNSVDIAVLKAFLTKQAFSPSPGEKVRHWRCIYREGLHHHRILQGSSKLFYIHPSRYQTLL